MHCIERTDEQEQNFTSTALQLFSQNWTVAQIEEGIDLNKMAATV